MTRRLLASTVLAAMVAAGAVMLSGGGDYNGNPTYCHAHGPSDFLWWYYECWLPDPPGGPF